MGKMVKKVKKAVKKRGEGEGYTKELKRKIIEIKKLYRSKILYEENYEKSKQKLIEDLNKLKEKKKAEKSNLTKLIDYMVRKK